MFASCADQIYVARWSWFHWYNVCIRTNGDEFIRWFAVAFEFDACKLARAPRPKPVVGVAIFVNVHATTVAAVFYVVDAPPMHRRIIIRELTAPLAAPRAKYFFGQFDRWCRSNAHEHDENGDANRHHQPISLILVHAGFFLEHPKMSDQLCTSSRSSRLAPC
jgi:hypothetical protein